MAATGKLVNMGYAAAFSLGIGSIIGSPFIKERELKVAQARTPKTSFYFLEMTHQRQAHWRNMMNWYGLDLKGKDNELFMKGVELYKSEQITQQEFMEKYYKFLDMEEENLDDYRNAPGIFSKIADGIVFGVFKVVHMRGKYKFYGQYDEDSSLLKAKMSKLVLDHAKTEGTLEGYALGVNSSENEVTGLISGKIGLKFTNGNVWHGNVNDGYLEEGIYNWTEMDMQYDGAEGICSWIREVRVRDQERWKKI